MYLIYHRLIGFQIAEKIPDLDKEIFESHTEYLLTKNFYKMLYPGLWHKAVKLNKKVNKFTWVIKHSENLPNEMKMQALLLNIKI